LSWWDDKKPEAGAIPLDDLIASRLKVVFAARLDQAAWWTV
jgi:hypothetical protein